MNVEARVLGLPTSKKGGGAQGACICVCMHKGKDFDYYFTGPIQILVLRDCYLSRIILPDILMDEFTIIFD